MERRQLGSHGPRLSVVGYGAWEAGGDQWGTPKADDEVIAAMHAAVDAGIDWIDTAEAYGGGRSEELVGRLVRERRDEVLVCTKVAHWMSGIRAGDVRRAVEGSLRRLGVEHVDLYQIHWPNEAEVPVEETWSAMAEVQDAGIVRWIGVSNFDRALVERCLPIRHVDSVQNHFSLLHRDDAEGLLPWLADRGVGYLAYGPLGFGLLTGALSENTTFDGDDWRSGAGGLGYYDELFAPGRFEANLVVVERLRPIARRLGVEVATLALRAAIDEHGVTGVIAGSRSADHVRSNASAGDLFLESETRAEIRAAVSEPVTSPGAP